MDLPLKRIEMDWEYVENKMKIEINKNYRSFYETIGSIELDNFIYIEGVKEEGIQEHIKNTREAYEELKEFIEQDIDLDEWMPVGYTIDGAYIFCGDKKVMVTDSGFEYPDVYHMSLLEFIRSILEDRIDVEHFPSDIKGGEHEIRILYK